MDPETDETTTTATSEGTDGPAGGQGEDTIAPQVEDVTETKAEEPEPVKPEPQKPAEPKPEPAKAERPKSKDEARFAELEAQIDATEFDPWSTEGKKVIKEHARLAARIEAQPALERAIWADDSEEYGCTVKQCKAEWTAAEAALPAHLRTAEGVEVAYRARMAARAKPEPAVPAPAKPKPKATPVISPGQVLPRGAGSVPPQPAAPDERTIEQKVIDGDKGTLDTFKAAYQEFFSKR